MSTLTQTDYNDLYYQFLSIVEGVESLVYYDTAKLVKTTIGSMVMAER